MIITANELKTKGISFVEKLMKKSREVFISVRGQKKFVILPIEEYERLKEAELESIIRQAEKDYQEGRYVVESAEEHFKRLGI
ncbi:prevent-host-death family protein [Thermodesulfatator indicus DSM 15286]|uniref:Antitoxin n=1 Tax=Thermodesulfatator indicus (strain DSM 15286 / JCM 11887 / CIR29812) TaxID=667014 RepID=F8ABL6_THEID|nr:type II toxin-antitoxin system prevent-host-death family antitoxin [Thermodesulfatator indicus]AEH45616.1 prevent-host-death family protein [Thermodesulfatator indicus DSM 15286]